MAAASGNQRGNGVKVRNVPSRYTPKENTIRNRDYYEKVVYFLDLDREEQAEILGLDLTTVIHKEKGSRGITDRDFRALSEYLLDWILPQNQRSKG